MKPLIHTTTADLESIAHACRQPYGFWLDSALVDPRWGRTSFYGEDPFLVLRSKGKTVEVAGRGGSCRHQASPFAVFRELLRERRSPQGGVVGYFAYELKQHIEELPQRAEDDLALPECYLCFYDRLLRYDPRLTAPPSARADGARAARPDMDGLRSTFTPEAYRRAVERTKRYITAGDIYQVNLSQRFAAPLRQSPFDLYSTLRQVNPAPFAAFLNLPEAQVLSASPERFLHFDPTSRRVQTRPIKGTRPRGRTPERDRALSRELLSSEKDLAENVMIVDVERNDLGRVAEIGSVRVPHLAALERFATVFHLTSTVEARLRDGCDVVDLLLATFPSGSITGAPKIRAMEIIDELEPTARSVYTGAIGYIGFDGSLDLNIAIRTMLVKGDTVYFQAGGGIVDDSDPELEYQETLDKASALARAVLADE
jgi:para-aminobenzoate synthetase component 1